MPRTRKHHVEFANLQCTSGKNDLVDMAESIVLPALFSKGKRKYGVTSYFLMNQAEITLPEGGGPAIAFEFVKDTVLRSEQRLEGEELVPQNARMKDSPSALVLLVLATHRLVYVAKTTHAPTLLQLEHTLFALFREQRERHVQRVVQAASEKERARVRRKLDDELPAPDVAVLPLASAESIEQIFRRLKTVRTLHFELFQTNAEYQPGPLFKLAEESRRRLRAEKAVIEQRAGSGKDGLDMPTAQKEVAAATRSGTARVVVTGKDALDKTLTQDNNNMRLRVPAEFGVTDPVEAAPGMYKALARQENSGTVGPPQMTRRGLAAEWRSAIAAFWKMK